MISKIALKKLRILLLIFGLHVRKIFPVKMVFKSAEALSKYIKALQTGDARNVIVYFVGTRVNGQSWCPDCVNSDPMVMTAIQSLDPRKAEFIEVEVGERIEWRDHENEFKKWFNITNIPTLIMYNDGGSEDGEVRT